MLSRRKNLRTFQTANKCNQTADKGSQTADKGSQTADNETAKALEKFT
jgi:hypothetical protein